MTETQDPNHKKQTADNTKEKAPKSALSTLQAKREQNLRENLLKRKQQARARSEQKD